ncbi:hypothetical protein POPTR_004G160200v4 [Populus trichocarpa]|uniref:Uncharacterized protein n=1 Tax=Populus trichocarpa TaxID=3694 RepID=A0ACC0T522_POPTR|nr:hypothetical protein POPTR_004G160200v4 [Populus trichocarpa]
MAECCFARSILWKVICSRYAEGESMAVAWSLFLFDIAYNITNGDCSVKKESIGSCVTPPLSISDGGHLGGLVNNLARPRPYHSANREASFGHAVFDTRNRTHVYYTRDCNEDVGNLF